MTKRNNKILFTFILITIMILSSSMVYAAEWINQSNRLSGTGCMLNVQNQRTRKWTAASVNTTNSNTVITWNSQISIGDELYIDAYTSYNGGKLWIYEDGVCVLTKDAGTQEHIYAEWTVKTTNMRIACSASVNASTGEALAINITAGGDAVKPVAAPNTPYCIVGENESITLTDNVGVVGYYISTSSTKPDYRANGWVRVTSSTETTITYKPTTDGVHYVFAKDAVNNISDVTSFEAGYLPVVPKPDNTAVKVGERAQFVGVPQSGTAAFTYQWYRNNENTNTGGELIPGATGSTYTFTAEEDDDASCYYVEVSNRFGSAKSEAATLIVYHAPVLGTIPDGIVKRGGTHAFTVSFLKQGQTQIYTYQWYKTNSASSSTGTIITGAIGPTYDASPTENMVQYYYCEVTNHDAGGTNLYTVKTNNAKLSVDVTEPVISLGSISPSGTHTNQNIDLLVNLTITESGLGFEPTNNLLEEEIEVYVNDVLQSTVGKVLTYNTNSDDEYYYTLQLINITGNGMLKIKIPAESVVDNFGNKNEEVTLNTNITVDNVLPTIEEFVFLRGVNDVYANRDSVMELKLNVVDNYGIETSEFTADDISVMVNGQVSHSAAVSLAFDKKNGSSYLYNLSLSNVEGNGPLAIVIGEGNVKDWGKNGNAYTSIDVKIGNQNVIIDNVAPTIVSIDTKLESFTSGLVYPENLPSWSDGWSNQDVFVIVNATDTNAIDYYTVSVDGGTTYTRLTNNKEQVTQEFSNYRYYRVYDKAGNYSQQYKTIKIDKTEPKGTELGIYELRLNGGNYVFDETKPSNKNIYFKATTPSDLGLVQAGIYTGTVSDGVDNAVNVPENSTQKYVSYITVTQYNSLDKDDVIMTKRYTLLDTPEPLSNDGYYEIVSTTTDKAGNVTTGIINKVYISKRAYNTIKLTNIFDEGSGVKSLTINVYNGSSSNVSTDSASGIVNNGIKAIDTIYVEKPEREYVTAVRLGKGTFYVEAVVEDGVGIKTVYHRVIVNEF